jgi:hypothetical protein
VSVFSVSRVFAVFGEEEKEGRAGDMFLERERVGWRLVGWRLAADVVESVLAQAVGRSAWVQDAERRRSLCGTVRGEAGTEVGEGRGYCGSRRA